MYTKILIPLDGSKIAENVLPYARYLARRFKIPVELLSAVDLTEMASYIPAERMGLLETVVNEESARANGYLQKVANSFGGLDVTCTVERGRADDVIVDKAERHGGTLIAMASHGRSGLGRVFLGSVAEKVLRSARNPLLIVRANKPATAEGEQEFKSILIPLDGSELAEKPIPMAAELATALGLEVTLLRAYRIPYDGYIGEENFTAMNFGELLDAARAEAKSYTDKKAADLKELGVPAVHAKIKEGVPADAIAESVGDDPGNLIVMASHGRTGVKRWVLGSVTEAVARHGHGPMLVLRPNEHV